MTAKIVVASPALRDVATILSDLAAKAGFVVAERYDRDLQSLYRRFAEFPESGAPRPALGDHIRIGVVAPYVVIYRQDETVVTIMRVVHGSREITRNLLC